MPEIVETLLVPDSAARSAQVGTLLAQIRDGHAQLATVLRNAGEDVLHWQPAPGTNTCAMLLAHVAVAEVHLAQVGLLAEKVGHPQDVLGIGPAETGVPLADGAGPPAALAAKPLAWFEERLRDAFAHTERVVIGLTDADLDRRIERPQPNGTVRIVNPRWVLHHMIEHLVSHTGQVQLLHQLHRRGMRAAS